MEAELDRELAEFDQLLLREQEILAQNRPAGASASGSNRGGGSGGSGGGSSGASGSGEGRDGAEGRTGGSRSGERGDEARSSESGSQSAESGGEVGGGSGEGGRSDRVPSDIPSGEDDDIVARQLREAAMNEDDPELRERLWDEYRAYKSGRRSNDRRNPEEQPR